MADIKHFDPDTALARVELLFWEHGGPASTSIQDVATATGLNRSSLYATFGGKQRLYHAALDRYLRKRAEPAFRTLAGDPGGLAAVRTFFDGLIDVRCSGDYAGWGCMAVNAHTGPERTDPEVRRLLDAHHRELRDALAAALETARARGEIRPETDPAALAETLALLAYGVNLRSRAGADADDLRRTVTATLDALEPVASKR